MGAETIVELPVPALAEEVLIDLAEDRREAIGVLHVPGEGPRPHVQVIGESLGAVRHVAGKEALQIDAFQGGEVARAARLAHRHLGGLRGKDADIYGPAVTPVHAENAKGVPVAAAHDSFHVPGRRAFPGTAR